MRPVKIVCFKQLKIYIYLYVCMCMCMWCFSIYRCVVCSVDDFQLFNLFNLPFIHFHRFHHFHKHVDNINFIWWLFYLQFSLNSSIKQTKNVFALDFMKFTWKTNGKFSFRSLCRTHYTYIPTHNLWSIRLSNKKKWTLFYKSKRLLTTTTKKSLSI